MGSRSHKQGVILIAGPTASGKSALALLLAERLDGTIINADSMQVYRDLRVITARPMPAEEVRVPHLLYGHVDAAENYSVGRWCLDAAAALALTKGLAAVPSVAENVRATIRQRLAAEGAPALHAELALRDPAMAQRLMPRDRARVARALEVVTATGRSLAEWQREGMPPALDPAGAIKVFLAPEHAQLRNRIEARFTGMLEAGALDEVRALAARGLDPALPAMKAHGVPWLIRHLRGEIALTVAAQGGVRDTWRYTRRQATWFRNRMPDWSWSAAEAAESLILREISRIPA